MPARVLQGVESALQPVLLETAYARLLNLPLTLHLMQPVILWQAPDQALSLMHHAQQVCLYREHFHCTGR